jgi:hypothetical protein
MKAVYALKAGTNEIAAKVEAWDIPMLVPVGVPYDVALEQSAGLTRERSGITPGLASWWTSDKGSGREVASETGAGVGSHCGVFRGMRLKL